jgi:hypothetical protein
LDCRPIRPGDRLFLYGLYYFIVAELSIFYGIEDYSGIGTDLLPVSATRVASMLKFSALLAACCLVLGLHDAIAQPVPQAMSCQASLQQLDVEWNSIGFATPSKPAQARVEARNGQVSSGPEVTYLTNQIRLAAQDCAAGRDSAGLQRIALIHSRLSRTAR